MNLQNLSDEALQISIEKAVQTERDSTSVVLHHLREVDRRRLYSKLKYQSLKDYAVKHLKYSESEAWLRISAMQLLKELPQIEQKINDGSLPLSNLVLAKRAFSHARTVTSASREMAPISTDAKLDVMKKLENVSKREALIILERETGVAVKASEGIRELSDGNYEIRSILSNYSFELIKNLKGALAHSHPSLTNGELIKLALEALKREIDPSLKAQRQSAKIRMQAAVAPIPEQAQSVSVAEKSRATRNSRYIPSAVRHHIWLRDKGMCTNCESKHAVQVEHIIPIARGGETSIENLKLLCRSCNQRTAIENFGIRKMQSYLKTPTYLYDFNGIRKQWVYNSRYCFQVPSASCFRSYPEISCTPASPLSDKSCPSERLKIRF